MKITKNVLLFVIIAGCIGVIIYGISMHQRFKSRNEFAERVFSLGDERKPPPQTIEGLRSAIAYYEKRIEQNVQDVAKTGIYWKLLAVRLQDRGLHGEALEALENAIYYNPVDPTLHYSIGLSAGIMAKSVHALPGSGSGDKAKYFALAEEAYRRAIELDGRYLRPRYGLAVLYVFELSRPGEAIPHLQRCLEISRNDVDVMFVLARAYYMTESFREAVDLYDRIITITKDEQKRIDARNNRQIIMGMMYG